jgi:hypothetical protein
MSCGIVVITTAMTLHGGLAFAQSNGPTASITGPTKGTSTGPTVPDTRPVDHGRLNTSSGLAASTSANGSAGLSAANADPANNPAEKP